MKNKKKLSQKHPQICKKNKNSSDIQRPSSIYTRELIFV